MGRVAIKVEGVKSVRAVARGRTLHRLVRNNKEREVKSVEYNGTARAPRISQNIPPVSIYTFL